MNRLSLILFLLASLVINGFCQKGDQQVKIVFYNVENLFDTIDDKHKNDNEFLPGSEKKWNTVRYLRKLQNLGSVLCAIDTGELPAVIGLAEVENREVLEDLFRLTCLSGAPYQVILEEGSDPRGIDVALFYRNDKFTRLSHKAIPASRKFSTRFILYVKLLGPAGDTLHLFVNHWKSRAGGEQATRFKRMENATLLREAVDSLFALHPGCNILILGDLNDEPSDASIRKGLGAVPPADRPKAAGLYNLFYHLFEEGRGTTWYRDWNLFDQIIASGNLLTGKKENGPVIHPPYGFIFSPGWMLDNRTGKIPVPRRTYYREYMGGYSDHLPVYTILTY